MAITPIARWHSPRNGRKKLPCGRIPTIRRLRSLSRLSPRTSPSLRTSEVERNVWKTIPLGIHPSPAAYRKALKSSGFKVSSCADDILNKVSVASQQTDVDLVVLTVAELGFVKGATRKEIYARAQELGLQLCPAEVGPALRLAYPDQPYGEWLIIAMESITDSSGDPDVFLVDHDDDGRWLSSIYGNPDDFWHADRRWVFIASRK
jgi:hypothetical protein